MALVGVADSVVVVVIPAAVVVLLAERRQPVQVAAVRAWAVQFIQTSALFD